MSGLAWKKLQTMTSRVFIPNSIYKTIRKKATKRDSLAVNRLAEQSRFFSWEYNEIQGLAGVSGC